MNTTICNEIKKESLTESTELLALFKSEITQIVIKILNNGKELSQTDIVNSFWIEHRYELSQSNASNKLSVLVSYDLLTSERKGQQIYYSLNLPKFEKIVNAINKFNSLQN